MTGNHRRLGITAVLSAAAFAQLAQASEIEPDQQQNGHEVQMLAPVVIQGDVLGSASEEEVRRYAGSRSVVQAQALEGASVRGLDDALQRVPGVKIFDETGTGVLPQLSVRGLYESRSGRVQALSDGIPLALAPYGQTSLSLFPQTLATVERIDIVRGGASVQYGPNNVGGVVNFISRPIPEKWETSLSQRITFAPAGRQLYDSYLGTGGRLSDNLRLQLDLNTITGEYGREHSETDVQNYRLRGEWDIDDTRRLSFGVQRYIADMELAGALSVADYKDDPRQSTRNMDSFEGDSDRLWGTYSQYFGAVGPFDDVEFSWTNFAHNSYRNFLIGLPFDPAATPTNFQDAPRDFRVWGSEPRVSLSLYGDDVSQTWLLGARLVKENVDFDVNNQDLATGATRVVRDWVFDTEGKAAYVSNEIILLDERLTITPGLRYEHATMEYEGSVNGTVQTPQKNVAEEWLPGLTVGYQATDDWFVYANAQRSLRLPQVFQIVRDGVVQAEISRNYEIGTRFTPMAALRIDVGVYRIDFDDQIVFANGSFRNLGSTRHQGLETEAFWTPAAVPGLDLHASYAYLDAEQRAGAFKGKEVPYSSKHQFSVDARYRFAGSWTYQIDGLYVSSAYSDSANSQEENATASVGELPAYWVWNTAIEREFKLQDERVLTTSAGVSNLFDRRYYFRGIDTSPLGRQPAPGRTLTVAMNYRF
ncbi:TonB-dependent receptor family protein [Halopseudomonas maritima]|uniref:TonB-dependent receptor family protein n=1 Tax=Halopseudomonas maritima TaxID=2918528 RepID=UPI001EEB123E|nr:TonB-dependent siderophore receptor [Halopseudomonas maritima]UJJ31138.1 TonB-dependent siderophore receptor [Halopseudomonas maritima]